MRTKPNTPARHFSHACYDDNSISELIDALRSWGSDPGDCAQWQINPSDWRDAIADALQSRCEDN